MTRLGGELRDPWGLLFGAIAGGTTWAALASITALPVAPIAVGVGVAVYGVKVLTGLVTGRVRRRARSDEPEPLPVAKGSDEHRWCQRARRAESSFDQLVRSARRGPVAERVQTFVRQADAALAAIERLAGQASLVAAAMNHIGIRQLTTDRQKLRGALDRGVDPRIRAELERSLAATQAKLESFARLASARTMLLARIESGTLGLEGLVARLAEVVALTETSAVTVGGLADVEELMGELEGLRAGLTEAEQVSTQVLTGLDPSVRVASDRGRRQTMPPR